MRSKLIKKYLIIATVTICLFFLAVIKIGKKEESMEQENQTELEDNSGYVERIALGKAEAVNFEYGYRTLNRNFFGNEILIPWFNDEMKQEIEDYAESVKGDLTQVWGENSIVSQGLVMELENMIYQSLNRSMDKIRWEEIQQSIYFETMQKLGMEKWHPDMEEMQILFPELKDVSSELYDVYDAYRQVCGNENCFDLFHIPASEHDNYVLAIDSGGSAGVCYIKLTELVNGEFVLINEFETQNAGYGTVIQYEGEFYYIFLQNNYNLKIYDGVRIYKLGENMEEENLLIKYLPFEYIWKNLYNTPEGVKWDDYIERIRDEITSDEYLENGTNESAQYVYFGEEEKAAGDFIVPENEKKYYSNMYYKIDFTNMGIPIYIRKSSFYPSNSYAAWHLKALFYLQNPLDDSILTLQNMELNSSIPSSRNPVLVQMWFKEMEGKVYTFCLYHVSDYNYMLNVVRFEGKEVNRVRTDILSPQRHFVLTEGRGN